LLPKMISRSIPLKYKVLVFLHKLLRRSKIIKSLISGPVNE